MRVWDSSQISGNLYVSVACKFLDSLYFSVGAPSLDPRRRFSLFRSVIGAIITLFHRKKYYISFVAFYTPHIGALIFHRYYLSNNLLKWLSVASARSFLFPGSATVKPRPLLSKAYDLGHRFITPKPCSGNNRNNFLILSCVPNNILNTILD